MSPVRPAVALMNWSVLVPPVKTMDAARVTPSPARPPEMAPLLTMLILAPTMPAPPAPTAPTAGPAPPAPPLPPVTWPPGPTENPSGPANPVMNSPAPPAGAARPFVRDGPAGAAGAASNVESSLDIDVRSAGTGIDNARATRAAIAGTTGDKIVEGCSAGATGAALARCQNRCRDRIA